MSTRSQVLITVAVVVAGAAYMIVTTVRSGEALEYYKHVHEVVGAPATWKSRRLQLHGNVIQGTIVKRKGALDFRFGLHRGGAWVDVLYSGILPDSLKDCAEIVVRGQLQDAHTFAAREISAKCPSKYDGKRQPGQCGAAFRQQVLDHRR
jgi:cytochrome c-type biogenesis protein CcmE